MQRELVNPGAGWCISGVGDEIAEQARSRERQLLVDDIGFDIERRAEIGRQAKIDIAEERGAVAGWKIPRCIIAQSTWRGYAVEIEPIAGLTRYDRRSINLQRDRGD